MAKLLRSGAPQTRDRSKLGVWNGPGSSVYRFAIHLVRDTAALRAPPKWRSLGVE
jgi:hypothetical protein